MCMVVIHDVDVDGETIDKVNSFAYIGAVCTNTEINTRRAKNASMELNTVWKDRGIRKELMKLVKALIWPVITYIGEGLLRKTMKEDYKQLKCGATEECCG